MRQTPPLTTLFIYQTILSCSLNPDVRIRAAQVCSLNPDVRIRTARICSLNPDVRIRTAQVCSPNPDVRIRAAQTCSPNPDVRIRAAQACSPNPDVRIRAARKSHDNSFFDTYSATNPLRAFKLIDKKNFSTFLTDVRFWPIFVLFFFLFSKKIL